MTLKCSHFLPHERQRITKKLPCVIYLHGNCGSRCDSLACINILLQNHITVFAFDFSGSGISEGEYVSLGYYEKEDVRVVVQYLVKEGRTSRIALWGRSMGAATAIICAAIEEMGKHIYGVIADSSFMTLQDLIVLLVKKYIKGTPKTMIRFVIKQMRRNILNRAKFDIDKLVPIEYARRCQTPIYIVHAWGDKFISISHAEKIFEEYGGPKCIMRFEGDHNSERPDHYYQAMCVFLVNRLIVQDPDAGELREKIFNKTKIGCDDDDDSDDSDSDEGEGIEFLDADDDGGGEEVKKAPKIEIEEVEGEDDEINNNNDQDSEIKIIHGKDTPNRKRRIGRGSRRQGRASPNQGGLGGLGRVSSDSLTSFDEEYPPSPSAQHGAQMMLPRQLKEEEEMKKVLIESAKEQMNQTEDEGDKAELMNKIIMLKLELEKIKAKKALYLKDSKRKQERGKDDDDNKDNKDDNETIGEVEKKDDQ